MKTDWEELHNEIWGTGDELGQAALDEILGDEWIEDAVEHILSWKQGDELALSCLRQFQSTKATKYAYRIYKASKGERADRAVWLIKNLMNRISFNWIEEFLNDPNVIGWGLGVLDQLLWTNQIHDEERVNFLLDLAYKNSNGLLSEHIQFIRDYIEARKSS